MWCCYKANSFVSRLLNQLLNKIGLLTQWLESKSRLPIPEFSGYHCMLKTKQKLMIICNTGSQDNMELYEDTWEARYLNI